jgi:hypothetical protein
MRKGLGISTRLQKGPRPRMVKLAKQKARAPGLHEAPPTDGVKHGLTQGEGDKDASPLLLRATDPNNQAQGRC